MRAFPAALERLTEQFARLPGIGMKSAQRLAFYVLSLPKDEAQSFAQAILDAKDSVRLCPVCQNLTDQELCAICADPERDHSLICVVAEPKDVIAMERAREYHGVYHVLHGVISPQSHVWPDDLLGALGWALPWRALLSAAAGGALWALSARKGRKVYAG